MPRKLLLLLFILLIPCFARDYFYNSIDIKAQVMGDSTILVNESWLMNFEGHFKEGYRYFYTDKIRVYDFSVFSQGQELPSRQVSGGKKSEFVWDIDVTDTQQEYLMQYKVDKGFQAGESQDRLYYTVVFRDRDSPIDHVSFELTFPTDITLSEIPYNLTHGNLQQSGPRTLYLEYDNLPAQTALDLELFLPKGVVDIPFDWFSFFLSVLSIILGIVMWLIGTWSVWFMFSQWSKKGRDPIVVHKSKMLANLKPAIAGVIVDEETGINEIIGTIVDLAIRGFIVIKEKKSFFGLFREQQLTDLNKDRSRLEDYEREILSKLFRGKNKVTTSQLQNKFYKHIPHIKDLINGAAFRSGLFDGNPDKVKEKYRNQFFLGPSVFLILWVITIILSSYFSLDYLFFFSLLSLLFLFILFTLAFAFSEQMPRKSSKGVEMRDKYDDLKSWMEKYPLKRQRLFDEFLPYAIAFGIGDRWVKKMEKLGKIEADWYDGRFTTAAYTSFYSSMSSSLSSSPSSSHSGGGGGFGGGGGVGGGGGGFR